MIIKIATTLMTLGMFSMLGVILAVVAYTSVSDEKLRDILGQCGLTLWKVCAISMVLGLSLFILGGGMK